MDSCYNRGTWSFHSSLDQNLPCFLYIQSDWAGPFLVRFEKGYRAHLKHGDELVHAIWAVPNTAQARGILRTHGEPMAEPVVE